MKNLIVRSMASVVFSSALLFAAEAQAQVFDQFTPLAGAPVGAEASLFLHQHDGETTVVIFVSNSAPNTLYTVWLRLADPSPLTAKTVAPAANPDDIESLASVTPDADLTQTAKDLNLTGDDGSGSDRLANGFKTNRRGHGLFFARLNYPIVRGAFQFSEFDPILKPVALDNVPAFSLRLAAHPDGTGHGLVPDVHVPSFDWQWK